MAAVLVAGLFVLGLLYPNRETDVVIDHTLHCVVIQHGASKLVPTMRYRGRSQLVVVDLGEPAQPVFRAEGFDAERLVALVTVRGRVQSSFTVPAGTEPFFFRQPLEPVRYVVVASDHTLAAWPPTQVQIGGNARCTDSTPMATGRGIPARPSERT